MLMFMFIFMFLMIALGFGQHLQVPKVDQILDFNDGHQKKKRNERDIFLKEQSKLESVTLYDNL